MPSRYIIKKYYKGGIYHVYNRGLNKDDIFLDAQDYKVFMGYLKDYLTKPGLKRSNLSRVTGRDYVKHNYFGDIELLAFCLMPNHFHLLIKQNDERNLPEFMRSLGINYSMYYNRRHKRVGPLFQGNYKAILVSDSDYLLHLSRYIHLNPLKGLDLSKELVGYDYSSYQEYLGIRNSSWIKPDFILELTDGSKRVNVKTKFANYREFMKFSKNDPTDPRLFLGELTID